MSGALERLRAIKDAVAALKAENAELWKEVARLEEENARLKEALRALVDDVEEDGRDSGVLEAARRALANKEGE
jgi:predicted RNase H-like nuclease (RuvC/YqgF family)